MHNLESVQENETYRVLWNFIVQTDHLFSARRPDQEIVNKKKKKRKEENLPHSGLWHSGYRQGKTERK